MTQPAVTFQVKQLEEHFNTRLFERNHGRIALTPAGRVVMDYAERILSLGEELDTRIGDLTGSVAGPLLLGASMTIAEYILPKILGEFKAEHPEVQAHMTVGNSETISHRVGEHTLDVGLIESPTYLPSLQNETCCDDELVLICAPDHAFASRKTVSPQEAVGVPLIRREAGSGTREFTDNYFQQNGVPPEDLNVLMELGSLEAIKGVVETGIAAAIVSRTTIARERKLGTLVALPLEPRLIRTLSVVSAKDKFRSRLLTAFIEFAMRRMRELAAAAH